MSDEAKKTPRHELIASAAERWVRAGENREKVMRESREADTDVRSSEENLGKAMNPGDQKEGEIVSVWVGDRVLCSRKEGANTYRIFWRDEADQPSRW